MRRLLCEISRGAQPSLARLHQVLHCVRREALWLHGDSSSLQAANVKCTDVQLQRVDRSEAMSFERDQEVMKILESVNDLSNVMKDLSVLIIDQGSILDRIDYNCEQVAMTVDDGRKQLIKAETHQKNSRMIICIYFLMVMCGIMTLVVVFQKM